TDHLDRQPGIEQRLVYQRYLRSPANKNSCRSTTTRPRPPLVTQPSGKPHRLVLDDRHHRGANPTRLGTWTGPQRDAGAVGSRPPAGDAVRGGQDASVVAPARGQRELDRRRSIGARKDRSKSADVSRSGAAPTVDRLVRIADRRDRMATAEQTRQQR